MITLDGANRTTHLLNSIGTEIIVGREWRSGEGKCYRIEHITPPFCNGDTVGLGVVVEKFLLGDKTKLSS